MFILNRFVLFLLLFGTFGCSTNKLLIKVIEQEFKKNYKILDSPDPSNYILVTGEFLTNQNNYRIDFIVIEKSSQKVLYKRGGINGSVDWISNTDLKICDAPAVPGTKKDPCYFYNILTEKRTYKK